MNLDASVATDATDATEKLNDLHNYIHFGGWRGELAEAGGFAEAVVYLH